MAQSGNAGAADDRDAKASVADARDDAGDQRDQAADQRDDAGDQRDQAADQRDQAGDQRDHVAEERDRAAEERDRAAEERDQSAQLSEESDSSALARRDAALDRTGASEDRRSGATERTQAEVDRNTALADRASGASERTHAEHDRNIALADRGASALEREDASLDELTGMYLRSAGFVELEREMVRASRTRQPLVLVFVEVDRLQAIYDERGRAAGDRLLLEVAAALRTELRSYDLIIRYRDDGFLCAISGVDMAAAAKRLALVGDALAHKPEQGSITIGSAELQPDDSPQGLIARADAALYRQRRLRSGDAVVQVWECGDLVLDEGTQSVTRAGSPVALTATEFKMLMLLVRNKTLLVPKGQLLGQVWGYDADDHVLAVHMSSLRHKLEEHGPRIVHTIRGSGYILRP